MRLIQESSTSGPFAPPEIDADSILDGLCPEAGAGLKAILSRRRLCRGQMLLSDGDPADFAYAVQSGGVKLLKSLPDGRTQMTGYHLPGDFIPLPLGNVYPYSIEAFADTVLCQFPRRGLNEVFERHPDLQIQFLQMAYDDLATAQSHMLLLGRMTMMERICSFLVDLIERTEAAIGPVRTLRLPLLRSEIGDLLGMTIETISRGFSRLQKNNVIAIPQSDFIEILDRPRIFAIASGDEDGRRRGIQATHDTAEHLSRSRQPASTARTVRISSRPGDFHAVSHIFKSRRRSAT